MTPGLAAAGEDHGRIGGDGLALDQFGIEMLDGAARTDLLDPDREGAFGDGGAEIHGLGHRLADAGGMVQSRLQKLRRRDAAEGADHVPIGRRRRAGERAVGGRLETRRGVEGVEGGGVGHAGSLGCATGRVALVAAEPMRGGLRSATTSKERRRMGGAPESRP